MSVSNNDNNNGQQAHLLCFSKPSANKTQTIKTTILKVTYEKKNSLATICFSFLSVSTIPWGDKTLCLFLYFVAGGVTQNIWCVLLLLYINLFCRIFVVNSCCSWCEDWSEHFASEQLKFLCCSLHIWCVKTLRDLIDKDLISSFMFISAACTSRGSLLTLLSLSTMVLVMSAPVSRRLLVQAQLLPQPPWVTQEPIALTGPLVRRLRTGWFLNCLFLFLPETPRWTDEV